MKIQKIIIFVSFLLIVGCASSNKQIETKSPCACNYDVIVNM